MGLTKLSALQPGAEFVYRGRRAVIMEHFSDGVLIQLLDSIGDRKFGDRNDWRDSPIREYLNGEFLEELTEGHPDEALDSVTDLTALDGTTTYGTCVDKVRLPTFDEIRKYRYIRPLPEDWEWTCTPASTPDGWDKNARYAWLVSTNGNYGSSHCSYSLGVRPALVLPSSLAVQAPGSGDLKDYATEGLVAELFDRYRAT